MGKGPEHILLQGGHTEGPETYERMFSITVIREMQIKTTMRYHFTPVRVVITNKSTKNKHWRGCVEKGTQCTVSGNADWCDHCGKEYGISSEN